MLTVGKQCRSSFAYFVLRLKQLGRSIVAAAVVQSKQNHDHNSLDTCFTARHAVTIVLYFRQIVWKCSWAQSVIWCTYNDRLVMRKSLNISRLDKLIIDLRGNNSTFLTRETTENGVLCGLYENENIATVFHGHIRVSAEAPPAKSHFRFLNEMHSTHSCCTSSDALQRKRLKSVSVAAANASAWNRLKCKMTVDSRFNRRAACLPHHIRVVLTACTRLALTSLQFNFQRHWEWRKCKNKKCSKCHRRVNIVR